MPTINNPRRPIYIEFDSSDDFYTNNDAVRGAVCVHPTERPNSIRIAFKGRCKMIIVLNNGKTVHKSKLELFSYEQSLFNSSQYGASYEIVGRGIERDGKVRLPFEFIFPTEVRSAPGDLYTESPVFEHQKGHPLPTSLVFPVDHGFKANENKVEYFLEVLVFKELYGVPDVIKQTLPFRPTDSTTPSDVLVARPKHSEFCIRGHKLNPEMDPNPGALTRLKWVALSKYRHAIPEARWKITANCPYKLVAGSSIPISFSFYQIGHSPEIISVPTVYIRQIRVKLTPTLTVRVPYQGFSGNRDIINSTETDIIDLVYFAKNKVMRHGMKLAEVGDLKLPPTMLPSCKTYGLRLAYRIKVVVYGECAQETFSVTALRDACEVVWDMRRPSAIVNAHPSPPAASDHVPPPEEQLPAYEPLPSYD